MKFRCLLFDLDGTLVDSRADITNSLNLTLAELGRPTLPAETVRLFIGEGVRLLLERALRATQSAEVQSSEVEHALKIYQRHYHAHLLDQTKLYPEVTETLASLNALPKAIVTNKPFAFTQPLLDGLGIAQYFRVVFGGDSLPERKPSPLMLLEAARHCEVEPAECLMIGDSWIDVEAGRKAGMKTAGYVSGFRGRTELEAAGANYLIERFSEITALVLG
ncbi:MAG: phosphoglycolate phosphatase [Acidobacteria bacterium]|nr:phosphoglycolate phosphatase [Acidobacteriota bacterium]MBI3425144.1 phosphoglycolate phosphatase [Acidobacteriota bacterium]